MKSNELLRLIVRKGDEYLVSIILISDELRWSKSPWDAWWTRSIRNVRAVARRVGGEPVIFNPVTGQWIDREKWAKVRKADAGTVDGGRIPAVS